MPGPSENQLLTVEQAARDLNWVINSPLLLNHPSSLQVISKRRPVDVEKLFGFLQDRFCIPVGRYFEWLVHFYLVQCLGFELIAHGRQIQVGNRTVGELDFLFHNDRDICHLETAVKFYLHLEGGHSSGSHFPGPNPADNFESKLSRLMTHQLPLSVQYAPEVTHREPFVKGMIFYRPGCVVPLVLPEGMATDHCRGTWIRCNELSALHDLAETCATECRFHRRSKPFWLSDDVLPLEHPELLTATELEANLTAYFESDGRPCMISVLARNTNQFEEFERLIVVDESWPKMRQRKFDKQEGADDISV